MAENDIARIEAKIDLLFRILLNLNVQGIRPYDFHTMNEYLGEIKVLFNLQIDAPEIDRPDTSKQEALIQELSEIDATLAGGDYLKKDELKLKNRRKGFQNQIDKLDRATVDYDNKIKQIEEEEPANIYIAFQKKIGAKPIDRRFL